MKILDFLNSSIINLVVTHKNSPTWLPWMKKHWKKFIALYVSRLDSFDWSKNGRSWTFFKGFKITLTVHCTKMEFAHILSDFSQLTNSSEIINSNIFFTQKSFFFSFIKAITFNLSHFEKKTQFGSDITNLQ